MDAALQRIQRLTDAQQAVRPHVGEIRVNIARDSAETVYGAALDALGVDRRAYPPSAWRGMFDVAIRAAGRKSARVTGRRRRRIWAAKSAGSFPASNSTLRGKHGLSKASSALSGAGRDRNAGGKQPDRVRVAHSTGRRGRRHHRPAAWWSTAGKVKNTGSGAPLGIVIREKVAVIPCTEEATMTYIEGQAVPIAIQGDLLLTSTEAVTAGQVLFAKTADGTLVPGTAGRHGLRCR